MTVEEYNDIMILTAKEFIEQEPSSSTRLHAAMAVHAANL